ncbi:MAG: mobile mystery protein B [Pseudonocardiales bacterium]|nr:MAG: mobile mystery protein B [Pseudonocardiales bacterium]
MTDLFDSAEGATPIDHEVGRGLKADWLSTHAELNAAEQDNILKATTWAFSRRKQWTIAELAGVATLRRLHARMLGDVWKWAGELRRTDVNIGPEWWRVPTEAESLCRDLAAQTADPDKLAWPAHEIAVRFHHRLVAIHLFVNGNGRHARLSADLIVRALGSAPLSWGGDQLTSDGNIRERYLSALRTADRANDYRELMEFATS